MHSTQRYMNKNKEDNRCSRLNLSHHSHICISLSRSSFVLNIHKMLTSCNDKHVKLIRKIIKYFGDFKVSRIESEKPRIDNFHHWLKVIKFLSHISLDVISASNFICVGIVSCFFLQLLLFNFKLNHFIVVLLCVVD